MLPLRFEPRTNHLEVDNKELNYGSLAIEWSSKTTHREFPDDDGVGYPANEHHVEGDGVVVQEALLAGHVDQVPDANGGGAPTWEQVQVGLT